MRRVLVSGGSRGIGAAIVEKFTSAGDKVVFIYKNSCETAEALCKKTEALALKVDLSDLTEAEKAVSAANELLGGLDVLVCNSAISRIEQICDTDNHAWQEICNTNLGSAFVMCREASKIMVRNHSGSIVNIGSIWGAVGASCEVAYSTTKAGIRGLTVSLAKELAPSGINVNCVEPGFIDTDMNKALSIEDREAVIAEIPQGRVGTPEEVASLVYFLACDSAKYITGQCIGIDGGYGR